MGKVKDNPKVAELRKKLKSMPKHKRKSYLRGWLQVEKKLRRKKHANTRN